LATRAVEPNDGAPGDDFVDSALDTRRIIDADSGRIIEVSSVGDLSVVRRTDVLAPSEESQRRVYTFVPRRARPPWVKPHVLVLGNDLPNYIRAERSFQALTEAGLRDLLDAPARRTGRRATPPVVAVPNGDAPTMPDVVAELEARGIPVVPLRDIVQSRCRLSFLDDGALKVPEPPWWRRALIRAMDAVVGVVGFAVLLAVLPFVAAAIWIEDRGPVFYNQERVGKGGRPFRLHKFRSMRPDAETAGPAWATVRDERVTRVGAFLRRFKVDELPQFINVMVGQMSVVGPRPERVEFVETLRKMIPGYDVRELVRPGITGWGTLRVGYGNSVEAKYLTHQYDMYHLKHRSLRFDAEIMARSLYAIVAGPERRDPFML
jgi:lipopolysaccharide/colanic/teichoic acid biosynthesis glycosyltransferase